MRYLACRRGMSDAIGALLAPVASRCHRAFSAVTGMAWVVLLALTKMALLLLPATPGYGYFRDELYFLDASKHLALGYVDFPPLVAFVGAALRAVGAISPTGLRLL